MPVAPPSPESSGPPAGTTLVDLVVDRYRPALLAAALLVPAVVAGLLALVRESLGGAAAVLVLVLVVVAFSATGVRLAGLLAALSSGVFFDVLLTQPYGTLAVSDPDDVEALVLLLAVGVGVTELALWGRRQQARASRQLGFLDGVLGAAEASISGDSDPDRVAQLVGRELTSVLRLDACRYEPGVVTTRAVIQPDGSVLLAGRPYDVVRRGLPTDDVTALPVRAGGTPVGTFVLTAATHVRRPAPDELRVAVLLADQLGRVVASHPA